ncbi:MAG TPA: hypothetical protein VGM91_04240, partial [Conexibacter sp.]
MSGEAQDSAARAVGDAATTGVGERGAAARGVGERGAAARAINPAHDALHAPDAARERWRESYYFKFWDFNVGIGGDSTIGHRPSNGHSGSLNMIWGLELPTLVASEYDHAPAHDVPRPVAGLAYEQQAPFGAWRVRFEGRLNDGGSAPACGSAAVAAAGSDRAVEAVPVSYDLLFEPDQPAYMYAERPEWDGLFDGHVDEVGRVTGVLTVGERTWQIDARGCKDHSWGVRDWARPRGWRWADMLFADGGPELSLWRATFDGEQWLQDGAVYANGEARPLRAFTEHVTWAPRDRAPRPATWAFDLAAGGDVQAGE